jgi:hypothetical protein
MGCSSPPELVVGEVGPIDLPAQRSPHECGFSVYGHPNSRTSPLQRLAFDCYSASTLQWPAVGIEA